MLTIFSKINPSINSSYDYFLMSFVESVLLPDGTDYTRTKRTNEVIRAKTNQIKNSYLVLRCFSCKTGDLIMNYKFQRLTMD